MILSNLTLEQFQELTSTQDYAKEKFTAGSINFNTVISAIKQTKGRGRYEGRTWESNEGNIAITICLKIDESANASQLCYVAANAVSQTLSNLIPGHKFEVKWVNDVLVGNKKIAGILIEKIKNCVLIGVGINLKANSTVTKLNGISAEELNTNIEHKVFLDKLLQNFISHFNAWVQFGFSPTRVYWIKNAYNLGREIKINYSDGTSESGKFVDIDEEGKLILDNKGTIKKIETGELFDI